jgi:hypothetical protein
VCSPMCLSELQDVMWTLCVPMREMEGADFLLSSLLGSLYHFKFEVGLYTCHCVQWRLLFICWSHVKIRQRNL